MADDSEHQARTCRDSTSRYRDARSHYRASCRADITNFCGEPNQARSHHGGMVSLARSQLACTNAGCLVCRGYTRAELGACPSNSRRGVTRNRVSASRPAIPSPITLYLILSHIESRRLSQPLGDLDGPRLVVVFTRLSCITPGPLGHVPRPDKPLRNRVPSSESASHGMYLDLYPYAQVLASF